MAFTDINSEDRLVQKTFAEHLKKVLGWDSQDKRGLSPLELVRRAARVHPELFRPGLAKLEKLDRPLLESIVGRVPADWMTPLAREFAVALVCYNLQELCKILDLHENADPVEILSVDGGCRATDSFEVFPKIERRPDGAFRCRFFLHGWRHVSESAQQRLQVLKPDERLHVAIELTSPTRQVAVQIQTQDYHVIGWSPRYLVSDLVAAIAKAPGNYEAKVVQVNPVPAPAKQRLLLELRGHWPDYDPMTKNDFEPLTG